MFHTSASHLLSHSFTEVILLFITCADNLCVFFYISCLPPIVFHRYSTPYVYNLWFYLPPPLASLALLPGSFSLRLSAIKLGVLYNYRYMTINPYVNQICEQTAMTPSEVRQMMPPMRPMTFPCVIHGRSFECFDDYINELHDYLNGL